MIKKSLLFAKELIARSLIAGDIAVDATCGNGHDTKFLAELVGEQGRVYGFDIQEKALLKTKERLSQAGLCGRVELIHDNHRAYNKYINKPVKAVMFNLGFLPGGDHKIVTQPEATVEALRSAVLSLQQKGIITIVVYTGHEGGQNEYDAVLNYACELPQAEYIVLEYKLINQINSPPSLIAINRIA